MIETPDENTRPAPTPVTAPVTVLGLGPMGRALASALLDAGHPVTVWNRTPGKAGDLLERGAVAAGSVQDAVEASQVIIAGPGRAGRTDLAGPAVCPGPAGGDFLGDPRLVLEERQSA